MDTQLLDYQFCDFKAEAPSAELIQSWLTQHPATTVLNRRSTTWRQLDDQQKALAETPKSAAALASEFSSLIKRPVLEYQGQVYFGFNSQQYEQIFNAQ